MYFGINVSSKASNFALTSKTYSALVSDSHSEQNSQGFVSNIDLNDLRELVM